jgi:hypothetical protein
MNSQTANRASGAALGIIIVSVIFAVVTVAIKLTVAVPAIDEDRSAERVKALNEIRLTEEKSLGTVAWLDQSHGTVRLPIETAMQLATQLGQNPAAARADLNARLAKSVAPVAAKPSAFE